MTTTTAVAPQVGDRVTYRGHAAEVIEPTDETGRGSATNVLLRFDEDVNFAWHTRDGRACWWVDRGDSNLTLPQPYSPSLGDLVVATSNGTGGTARQGTVYLLQRDHEDTGWRYAWVGGVGPEWADATRYSDMDPNDGDTFHVRQGIPHADAPEGTRGRWSYLMSGDTVTPVTPNGSSTVEEAPSDPAEARALRARAESAEAESERLRSQIRTMENDLRTIGTALKETANRHEWCGEYESHLSDLYDQLSTFSDDILKDAAKRTKTYTVTYTYTTTVEAEDVYSAREEARDCYSTGDLDGSWEAEEDF